MVAPETFVLPCWCGEKDAPRVDHEQSCPVFLSPERLVQHIGLTGGRCNFCGVRMDNASRGRTCADATRSFHQGGIS